MPGRFRAATLGAVFFAVVAALPASRAATGDGLRAILALVPAAPEPRDAGAVDYFDLAVAAAITGKRGLDGLMPIARRVHIPYFGEMLASADAWKGKAGFALGDVDAVASAGPPPDSVRFFRLAPAVTLESLTPTWTANGFRETPSAAAPIWGRGAPRAFDVAKVDPDDPFGGTLGRSSFLLPELPILAESFGPEPLVKARRAKAEGALAARADVAALLAALDRDGGQLLQAMLLAEPAASMAKEGDQIAFSALLLADLDQGERTSTLILLAFGDCAAARAAKSAIEQGWAGQHPAIGAHVPAWTLRQGRPCVLQGRIAAAGTAAARNFANESYHTLVDAWMRRDLTAFVVPSGR